MRLFLVVVSAILVAAAILYGINYIGDAAMENNRLDSQLQKLKEEGNRLK